MRKFIAVFMFVLSLTLFSGYVFSEVQNIVYVDYQEIGDNYKKYADYMEQLEDKRDEGIARLREKGESVKKLQEEMKLLKESEKEKKEKEFEDRLDDYKKEERRILLDFKKEKDEKLQEVYTDVKEAVAKYAKKNKIKIVLTKLAAIAYADKSLDRTKQVIKILNKEYKK